MIEYSAIGRLVDPAQHEYDAEGRSPKAVRHFAPYASFSAGRCCRWPSASGWPFGASWSWPVPGWRPRSGSRSADPLKLVRVQVGGVIITGGATPPGEQQ